MSGGSDDVKRIADRLAATPDKIAAALAREMTTAMIEVSAIVKNEKLSGQVLHTRTGRLRRSIHADIDHQGATIIGTVGTNVEYARIQEYGGVIWRIPRWQTIYRKVVRNQIKGGFVRASKANYVERVGVGGYTIRIPERSYLRSTLREQADHVRERLIAAAHTGSAS